MSNELTHNPGQFDEVIHIIDNARSRAMKAVNAELIQMYWEIGSYVSGRVKDGGWETSAKLVWLICRTARLQKDSFGSRLPYRRSARPVGGSACAATDAAATEISCRTA